jgi:predicted RNase H-like HicB family nuclease
MPKTEQPGSRTIRYVSWQDRGMWLGFLDEYPDYMTQGETSEDLQGNLRDVYKELTGGHIPAVRKVSEPRIA